MYVAEKDKPKALRMAQQLVIASSEFHATGLTRKNEEIKREQTASAIKSCRRYKAVVHILLAGGCDSFNLLVPHSRCEDISGKGWTEFIFSCICPFTLKKLMIHLSIL